MGSSEGGEPDPVAAASPETLRQLAGADAALALDAGGHIRAATGVAQTLGYRPEELTGEPVTVLRADESAVRKTRPGRDDPPLPTGDTESAEQFRETLLNPETRERRLAVELRDGTGLLVSATVVPRADDGAVCLFEEGATVSTLPVEDELLDAVADPMYVLDAEGRFARINDAMVSYTGYERRELVGRHCSEIVPAGTSDGGTPLAGPSDGAAEAGGHGDGPTDGHSDGPTDGPGGGRETAEYEAAETVETPLLTSSGTLVLAETHVTPVTDPDGEHAGAVGVLRDIQERKRRERDLELLKDVLTRVFRHNVRNELSVVHTRIDLLDRELDSEGTAHTDAIRRATETLLTHTEKARLIEQVVETDRLAEIDIGSTVERLVERARKSHPDATIEADVPSATVEAHPEIGRAIGELLANALEHAPGGSPWVSIRMDTHDDTRTLFIEDESGGLADHELAVLRRGEEDALQHSSGVGLWLVRWLVEYSNAEIIVHRTGEGTVMGIRFHVADSTAVVTDSPVSTTPDHVRNPAPEQFRGDIVVGRAEPLERLEEMYDGLAHRGGQVAVLTGEAGIGKTTLVERFRERLTETEPPPAVGTGFCGTDIRPPYHAFEAVMDDLPTDRDISQVFDEAAAVSASDAGERQRQRRALFADIADQLRAVATDRPVVIVLEDMQWANSGTLDLFEYLLEEVGQWGHPVMFLGTCRTSGIEQSGRVADIAERLDGMGRGTVIELDPLDEREIRVLFGAMLDVEDIPAEFVTSLRDHTGGTPLFLKELGLHLVERADPVETGEALPDIVDTVAVPETVERTVAERLDAVPEPARQVLQVGAVLGREFTFDVLRAASECPEDTLIESIDTLTRRHIWERSADDIAFVHGVVREQVFETIDDERRRQLHGRAAAAIERVHGDDLAPHAGRLAVHFERVGDYERAIRHYRRGAEYASERYANDSARADYERALALAREHECASDRTLAATCADLAALLVLTDELDDAAEIIEEGLEAAPDVSEAACRLLGIQAQLYRTQGEFEASRAAAAEQRETAATLDAAGLEADALNQLGDIALRQSEHDRAREYYERSLDRHREAGNREGEANVRNSLGILATIHGNYDRARELLEESLAIYRERDDRDGESNALNNLGILAMECGEYDRARECYERGLELNREVGNRRGVAVCLNSLGNLEAERAAYDDARECLRESLTIHRELGDRHGVARALHSLADIAAKQGARDDAREFLDESLDIRPEIGDRRGEAVCLSALGRIAIDDSALDRAGECLEEALEIAREVDAIKPEITSRRHLGRLARVREEYDRAADHLDASLAACEEGGDARDRVETRLERVRLALARDRVDRARTALDDAKASLDDLEAPHAAARATLLAGDIAAADGDPDGAREHWRDALERFEAFGAFRDALATLARLTDACHEGGDTERAEAWQERAEAVAADAPESLRREFRSFLDGGRPEGGSVGHGSRNH